MYKAVRRLLSLFGLSLALLGAIAGPAAAYEYQSGDGAWCPIHYHDYGGGVSLFGGGYGDSNLYSSFGTYAYAYNIPYWTWVDFFELTRFEISAVAMDSENYVEYVGASCWPYD